MTSPAILVDDLEKVYRIYRRSMDAIVGRLWARRTWEEYAALDKVSFQVPRGQSLGIVGRNGAGKSTLLKLIAGTLQPTSGRVVVDGSISAILELGSGFHPEFSGRDNVYLGALCLGLTRRQIDEIFDDIVDFAELRDAIDRPFRTYSTGMQARLSFSVAASLNPDVMIVDEALSVGDARFQAKCFRRFEALKAGGTTILLVSHSMPTIVSFCDRAILIEKGRLIEDGDPKDIDTAYQRLLYDAEIARGGIGPMGTVATPADGRVTTIASRAFGSGAARIVSATLYGDGGEATAVIENGRPFRLDVRIVALEHIEDLAVGFLIRSPKGVDIFGVDTATDRSVEVVGRPGQEIIVSLEGTMWLAAGEYLVTIGVAHEDGRKIDMRYDEVHFRVSGTDALYTSSIVNLGHRLAAGYV